MGATLPNIGFTDLDGRHHTLAEFRGQVLLIDIWATWCHGCREEMAALIETYQTYQTYHERHFAILGVSFEDVYGDPGPAPSREVAALVKMHADTAWKLLRKIPWLGTSTLVSQRPGEEIARLVALLAGGRRYPLHVLVDSTGTIVETDQDKLRGIALDMLLDRTLPDTVDLSIYH